MHIEDTIAAISTSPGHGGIGIVRVSGSEAIQIADKVFCSTKKKKVNSTPSHRIIYGHIVDPLSNEIIDEVLVSVMKAPNTYTREDLVEINCHGGAVPVRRVLELLLQNGARLAEPGEFTQRAFLNGRIDLAQAEAVLDVINALTVQSQKTAVRQLRGSLSEKIEAIRENILELTALVEACIDFPDEDIEAISLKDMKQRAAAIMQSLKKLIDTSRYGIILREGLKTAIIGRPNVGKSSLLNALLEHDRAIVTEIPGTTRDVIEEYLNIQGLPVRIMDTAGIRDVKDLAEKEGVKRSLIAMEDADLVLLVLDGSNELHETDKELLEKSGSTHTILVINKSDLPQKMDIGNVIPAPDYSIRGQAPAGIQKKDWIPGQARNDKTRLPVVHISAKKETGLDELKNRIAEMVLSGSAEGSAEVVTNARHLHALQRTLQSIDSFSSALSINTPPELLAVELREALDAIGEIIGITTPDDILNKIFSSFCVGK